MKVLYSLYIQIERGKEVTNMIITSDIAEKVIVKRAKKRMTKTELSELLNISRQTLVKIEAGNYKAPKRIYQTIMEWLLED